MEEVKRVTTKKKANTGTIILVVLAALLGLGLIGAAVYFYAIESPEDRIAKTESTCACYYIDPAVVSECGDPKRGFLFETATISGDQVCRAGCATSKLSVDLLNSNTKQELYQICQLHTISDSRCTEMIVKDKKGKIVTGRVSYDDELNITATFDKHYSDYKIIVNNQDFNPDEVSPDGLTITKKITQLDSNTVNIAAVATAQNGEQIGSNLCRRLIEIERDAFSDVTGVTVETRMVDNIDRISRIKIGVGSVEDEETITLRFSFDKKGLVDLIMTEGFTLDSSKGEITIIEQDLYNSENFGTDTSFAQLDGKEETIEMTATVSSGAQVIGSASKTFTLKKTGESSGDPETEKSEESNFSVSKTSINECVERVAPNNTAQFTITVTNNSSVPQKVKSIKDKLPLGFKYISNTSKIKSQPTDDQGLVSITNIGESQEIVWQKEEGWSVDAGQNLTIEFQSQVGENALSGQNQNEAIVTPEEVPAVPTTLRAEYVILVAQDCSDPDAIPDIPISEEKEDAEVKEDKDKEKVTVVDPDATTTPETGKFDSTSAKVILGLIILTIGWYIYSKPLGQSMTKRLVESKAFKEAEISSWRILKPKKYFETKVVKNINKKKKK